MSCCVSNFAELTTIFFTQRYELRFGLLKLCEEKPDNSEQTGVGRYFRFSQFPSGFTFLSSLKLRK